MTLRDWSAQGVVSSPARQDSVTSLPIPGSLVRANLSRPRRAPTLPYRHAPHLALLCLVFSPQYVAAFAVSALGSNWDRLGKPFNPLLGETYELERPEFR